jgi:ferric-dicitrate binding protein FerR (iron transport regulator)
VDELDEPGPTPRIERARRQRRRSIALALLLAALAVLFYIMAIMHGPAILNRPI